MKKDKQPLSDRPEVWIFGFVIWFWIAMTYNLLGILILVILFAINAIYKAGQNNQKKSDDT